MAVKWLQRLREAHPDLAAAAEQMNERDGSLPLCLCLSPSLTGRVCMYVCVCLRTGFVMAGQEGLGKRARPDDEEVGQGAHDTTTKKRTKKKQKKKLTDGDESRAEKGEENRIE